MRGNVTAQVMVDMTIAGSAALFVVSLSWTLDHLVICTFVTVFTDMRYSALAMHSCQAVPAVQIEIIRYNELGFELLSRRMCGLLGCWSL